MHQGGGADVNGEDENSEGDLALPSSSAQPRAMGCWFSLQAKPPRGMEKSPLH